MQNKFITLVFFILINRTIFPQLNNQNDLLLTNANLQTCVNYALLHQPSIKQSLLDEKIVNQQIKSKLADWFPQLNLNFNFQHNYKLPTSIFQGNPVHIGLVNTSNAQFTLTETLFDRDVLFASSTASNVRQQASQSTINNKINLVVNVSKAYYSVLLALQQINLASEDIIRLQQSYKDAYYQYKSGTVDKTDYERASISLNNSMAEQKFDEERLKTNYASLKNLMGYPVNEGLTLAFDSTEMEKGAFIDTTITLNYNNRIEYKLLQTQLKLQKANLNYNYWSFLPTLTAFGNYNFNFQNDELQKLYNINYPSEYVGITLSLPIFQGGKRFQEIDQASLEVERNEYDIASLKNLLNVEYTQAMANYKSNLSSFNAAKKNLILVKDVYNTIELQYKAGVKTYLDVITAETDLRTTEVNYSNSLYQLLSSKLDVEKALGIIKY